MGGIFSKVKELFSKNIELNESEEEEVVEEDEEEEFKERYKHLYRESFMSED
jgi:hypothetical protein